MAWRGCNVGASVEGRTGANRVIRGGSWINNARNCRCAYRNRNEPENRNNNLGFRCARAHDRDGRPGPEQTLLRGVERVFHRLRHRNSMAPGVPVAGAAARRNLAGGPFSS
jgi:hypothetical protein